MSQREFKLEEESFPSSSSVFYVETYEGDIVFIIISLTRHMYQCHLSILNFEKKKTWSFEPNGAPPCYNFGFLLFF